MENQMKTVINEIKSTPNLIIVWVIMMFSIVSTSIWLFRNTTICKCPEELFSLLAASVLTLLGVAIASFIFLHSELQERKRNSEFMAFAIDQVLSEKRTSITTDCILGLISFLSCLWILVTNSTDWIQILFFSILSYFSIARLLQTNIVIINHNKIILNKARQMLKKCVNNYTCLKDTEISSENVEEFIKRCVDLNKFFNRLVNNHIKQIEGISNNERIKQILLIKNSSDSLLAEKISNDYENLTKCQNLLYTIQNLNNNNELKIQLPLELPKKIEDDLICNYLNDELLNDITFSAKKFVNGKFKGTSFNNSLLYEVDFTGDSQQLDQTSFNNSRLVKVNFEFIQNVIGMNFYNTVFIDVNFPNKKNKFLLCNFSNSDFSKQGNLQDLNFELTNFSNTNFSGTDSFILKNIVFELCDCSYSQFSSNIIDNCGFNNSTCEKSIFTYSFITDTRFRFANLSKSSLFRSKLNNCNFQNARLSYSNLIEANIIDCDFTKTYCNFVSFQHSEIKNSNFDLAILSESDFSQAKISEKSTFIRANFTNSIFVNVWCNNIDFSNSIFINSQIVSGEFFNCDFSNVIFDSAVLNGVAFYNCNFTGATFDNAIRKNNQFVSCTGVKNFSIKKVPFSKEVNILKRFNYFNKEQFNKNNHSDSKEITNNYKRLDAILDRHSTRNFDNNFSIDKTKIEKIFASALLAPSSKNRQPWKYYIINNPSLKMSICDIIEEKNNKNPNAMISNTIETMKNASVIGLVGYDSSRSDNSNDYMTDILSIGASIENLILDATNNQISTLWICDLLIAKQEIKEKLNLDFEIVSAVLLGKELTVTDSILKNNIKTKINWIN